MDEPKVRPAAELTLEQQLELLQDQIRELQAENRSLREQAYIDPLTGMYNRRGFEKAVAPLLATLPRKREQNGEERRSGYRRVVSVLFLDIDHFHRLNETYRHRGGDQILQQTRDAIYDKIAREGVDVVLRYGGEEIVVVYSGYTATELIRDRLRNPATGFAQFGFTAKLALAGGETREAEITMSGGAADYVPGEPLDDTIARANEAMHAAKKKGRNRIFKAPYPKSR